MIARIHTVSFQGIEVLPVDVQAAVGPGLPAFTIVGLADKAVAESRERVRAALNSLGLALPAKRITINLAPADLIKEGSHFDLPVALALLATLGALPLDAAQRYVVLGELGLDGGLAPVNGVLPAAVHAMEKNLGLICPEANGAEAAWVAGLDIAAAPSLLALLNNFKGGQILPRPTPALRSFASGPLDLRDVKGQETAKRALEIAAVGGHNMLMIGPPGSGKSMLASRLPSILPPLSAEQALEVSMIHSIAGYLKEGRISETRPYRDPHHSASLAAMIGGGMRAQPGEISLAHHGVLFLDELPEFSRQTLESLRQPIEAGRALIARANAHVTYPARFQLIAAMNPCRCGFLDDPGQSCGKAPRCGADYQSKISGPIFDRIDLHVDVPAVKAADLHLPHSGENSEAIRVRVLAARQMQADRAQTLNAQLDGEVLEKFARPDAAGQNMLNRAADQFHLTARGYHRILRVARSIADLAGSDPVGANHVAEALSYRRLAPATQF